MLILQQTLLMGVGDARRRRLRAGRPRRPAAGAAPLRPSSARVSRILLLALPGFALYLVVLPRIYGFSANEPRWSTCSSWPFPFILSVSFLGQFVGSWFKRRETAVLLLHRHQPAALLPGRRRVAGRSHPAALRTASFILPSTSAIDGLVRINQMGATLGRRLQGLDAAVGASPRSMRCWPSLAARIFMPRRSAR